jgi:polysaccharide biosynthesis transport protein
VGKSENKILELLERTRVVLQSELSMLTSRLDELQKTRTDVVREMTESSISQKVDQETESDYSFYQQLYSDMRVKLEQARIARELGRNAENAFIIIDPARIPTKPTKPNRTLVVGGGMAAGMLLGILLAAAAELLDTTIRSPQEIDVYQKPIIALLPEGVHLS